MQNIFFEQNCVCNFQFPPSIFAFHYFRASPVLIASHHSENLRSQSTTLNSRPRIFCPEWFQHPAIIIAPCMETISILNTGWAFGSHAASRGDLYHGRVSFTAPNLVLCRERRRQWVYNTNIPSLIFPLPTVVYFISCVLLSDGFVPQSSLDHITDKSVFDVLYN